MDASFRKWLCFFLACKVQDNLVLACLVMEGKLQIISVVSSTGSKSDSYGHHRDVMQ